MPMYDLKPEQPGLPRLGKIRLGVKSVGKDGKERPEDRHFFVLRDAPKVAAVYPSEPVELLIYLPFENPDENMPNWHKLWRGSVCHCQGDGRQVKERFSPEDAFTKVIREYAVLRQYTEDDGRMYRPGESVPCPGSDHLYPRCTDCKPETRLLFMVRDPLRLNESGQPNQIVANEFGLYEIRTSSVHNYRALAQGLAFAYEMSGKMRKNKQKDLTGIPMILRREPQQIVMPMYSKEHQRWERRRGTKHLLTIRIDFEWMKAMGEAMYTSALEASRTVLQITAGEAEQFEQVPLVEGDVLDEDEEVVGDMSHRPAPSDNAAHDWRWFYEVAAPSLGFTVNSAKEALPKDFAKRMSPDECFAYLKNSLLPKEVQNQQPGLFG